MKKKAVLIDVSAVMYRAYFSLINMRTSKGIPTGAVYGFLNTLDDILTYFKPNEIYACFDVKKDTLKRKKIYDEYKATRKPMPEDLLSQIKYIEDLLGVFNIDIYKKNGYEADDIIGTLAKKLENQGKNVYIITKDKDLSQVYTENIKIALLSKGNEKFKVLETEDDIIDQLGVYSHQIPDLFGLQGDTSDNIPGVKGIGPKTAIKLIEEYKTLENIYENIEKIKGKNKENLILNKHLAFLSRELATICGDIELDFLEKDYLFENINKERLFQLLFKFEFKGFIKKYDLEEYYNAPSIVNENEQLEENIIDLDNLEIIVANNENDVYNYIRTGEISIYVSSSGISLSNGKNSMYISTNHSCLGALNLNRKNIINYLNNNISKSLIGFDIKEIMKSGFNFNIFSFDTMIAAHILDSEKKYDLEKVVFDQFNIVIAEYKDLFKKEIPENLSIKDSSVFFSTRAYLIHKLKDILKEKLIKDNLYEIYNDIEMKLIEVLNDMESEGIKIDVPYLKKYSIYLENELNNTEKEIYNITGNEFNINSPKQLSEILFEKMGIVPIKKTKTGYSTDEEVLNVLDKRGEKIANYILKHRTYSKLKNTYVDTLKEMVDSKSRLHTTFHQTGTATGRLSSSEPNLQNIPVKTDEGIKIREAFVCEEGYSLLGFDYSQIELRVLSELSKDAALIDAYNNDCDLHNITAMKIMDIKNEKDITKLQRTIAKIVNFSIIYGKTPFGLSKELDITVGAAKEYIDKYFREYKSVDKFIQEVIKSAEENGAVYTYFKRKREINNINSKNKNIKAQADRMAVNTVVQGTAADILKITMIKLYESLKNRDDIKMLLQIHDELIFEVRDDKLEYYKDFIKNVMENTVVFNNVKLKVNVASGKKWSEL
ncbi:MAG: DNA polymerase I [Fusobacteria bacterium]|nr:DNA polymerase I [Fusobacteriota bacterium]